MTSESVNTLTLLLPGLLFDGELPPQLNQFASAQRFLAATDPLQVTTASLESEVLKWFHGDDAPAQNCAAFLGYRLDSPQAGLQSQTLCVQPVYQQMDINHAVLADSSVLSLSESEAQSIINDLNRFFTDDGLCFEYAAPHRWYGHFDQPLELSTQSPGVATGHDVSMMMPRGADARRWRTALTEIEMLLHAHPVNQHRQSLGQTVINSLWLWGEGAPTELPPFNRNAVQVFSENFYCRSVAGYHGCSILPLDQLGTVSSANAVLIADHRFAEARATGDQQLHESLLQTFDAQIFNLLLKHRWSHIALWGGGEHWRHQRPNALMRAWSNWFSRVGRRGA